MLERTENSKLFSNPFPGLGMQPSRSDRHLVDGLKICGPTRSEENAFRQFNLCSKRKELLSEIKKIPNRKVCLIRLALPNLPQTRPPSLGDAGALPYFSPFPPAATALGSWWPASGCSRYCNSAPADLQPRKTSSHLKG